MYVCFYCFLYVFVGDFDDSRNVLFSVRVPDSFDIFFQSKDGNRSRRDVRLETRRATVVRGRVCEVAAVVVRGQVVPTAKLGVVRTQHQLILTSFLATDAVVRVRVDWVPVEDKNAIASFERNHLVAVVFQARVLVVARHVFEETSDAVHLRVKRFQEFVSQVVCFR